MTAVLQAAVFGKEHIDGRFSYLVEVADLANHRRYCALRSCVNGLQRDGRLNLNSTLACSGHGVRKLIVVFEISVLTV